MRSANPSRSRPAPGYAVASGGSVSVCKLLADPHGSARLCLGCAVIIRPSDAWGSIKPAAWTTKTRPTAGLVINCTTRRDGHSPERCTQLRCLL
ncbi:hypothetical protein IE81DRAFT_207034 [Ceraceosorus guamensis]|uniref:Uncharacterized protein n=1 Tax=Ceraceosorus guamensis TaxID=1522189 RepID=A0A316WB63_9BASI|nr:hypothetical protein IE81DRAFT_207034 [Ceraceosorus guamensis]PWN45183.1 hypothetical protein IE81DRAFT_207034 [Ceraceosorus guamensis]